MEPIFQRPLDQQKNNKALGEKKLARSKDQDHQKFGDKSALTRPFRHLHDKQGKSECRWRPTTFRIVLYPDTDYVPH